MHVHTTHSDGFITVRDILASHARTGLAVAITDHNSISGVREAISGSGERGVVIPGVEVSASDGPHILLYFERFSGLEGWFSRTVREKVRDCPYMAVSLTSEEILDSANDSGALVVAAHPYGYSVLPRGILKCVENGAISDGTCRKIDGLEVISGVLSRRLNERAVMYARRHHLVMTGGSDAHMVRDLGHVVTCARAGTTGEFLEELRKRRNLVIGQESGPAGHILSGSAVLTRYLPYVRAGMRVHLEQNLPAMGRLVHRKKRTGGKKG
jgi:predicted metal-dependent phosphoesterase TrpH